MHFSLYLTISNSTQLLLYNNYIISTKHFVNLNFFEVINVIYPLFKSDFYITFLKSKTSTYVNRRLDKKGMHFFKMF